MRFTKVTIMKLKICTLLICTVFFAEHLAQAGGPLNHLVAEYDQKGNPKGEYLFPKADGANLRILDMNIWQWDGKKVPEDWVKLGADCTNKVRCEGYTGLVQAYLPEVICLQEYSMKMHEYMYPSYKNCGYEMTFLPDSINYTPIYYMKNKLKLISTSYVSYALPYNNHGTKSYTTAVFRLKANKQVFAVINTHLWWKSEKVMAGSDNARLEQVRLILKEAEKLRKVYSCPVFIMGDLNCNLRSEALRLALDAGYRPAWEVATEYGDLRCGHHQCNKNGFSRVQNKTDDGFGCIDHFFVHEKDLSFDKNKSDNSKNKCSAKVEVKVFKRDYAWFTVMLTDHYPNYADIELRPAAKCK